MSPQKAISAGGNIVVFAAQSLSFSPLHLMPETLNPNGFKTFGVLNQFLKLVDNSATLFFLKQFIWVHFKLSHLLNFID